MNADTMAEFRAAHSAGFPEPYYFHSDEHQLFAWLHCPERPDPSRWGAVICKPFGYEASCAHRGTRAFAEAAAGLGMPTLRFDYRGTGDSSDISPDTDQITGSTMDIVNAVAELRRVAGVQRVCLIGFRLGALLATLAVSRCQVDALALIAPVLNGRRFLKDARTSQLAAAAAEVAVDGPAVAVPGKQGSMELNGFLLSAASVATLSGIDLKSSESARVPKVLVIDRSDLPTAAAWAESLRADGVQTHYTVLPGIVEMMMTKPHLATLPLAMLATTRDWLSSLMRERNQELPSNAPHFVSRDIPNARAKRLQQLADGSTQGAAPSESPIFLAADATAFGILSEPASDEPRRRAVILLNTGSDYHIGASRMYVSFARRWVRAGYYVLRMDLSGLGDSAVRPGNTENDVFPEDAVSDIRAAVEYMRGTYQVTEVTLLGLCSGAYHALRAACDGVRANRIILVNPVRFLPEQSRDIDGVQLMIEVGSSQRIYSDRIVSLRHWLKLLRGQADLRRIIQVNARRAALVLASSLRGLARKVGMSVSNHLGQELETMASRGVQIIMIFARNEPGIYLLTVLAGSALKRLGKFWRMRVIDSGDHTFSRGPSREILENVLSEELFARSPCHPVPNASTDEGICTS